MYEAEAPSRLQEEMSAPPIVCETRSGEGVVFLDLQSDEYSCSYEPLSGMQPYSPTAPPLSGSGISITRPPVAEPVWLELASRDAPVISLRDVSRFATALLQSVLWFRNRPVRELLHRVSSRRDVKLRAEVGYDEVARRFDRLLAMLPVQPACLFRSFFLLNFMHLYGLGADWNFGVQLFPFRAHCWVARGNMLLNETSHAIEEYRVIHAVRATGG
ncbi:lasso peptide biosynthesis B2 protein [Sphingomonas adhaesiva]|uniref:lasso peptide biosynthesis B2 protein n=1 Tax=Sphingomonas adhaesiva TaxID=28212 RepID=UPI002FFB5769